MMRVKDVKFIKQLCLLTLGTMLVSAFLMSYLTRWWPYLVFFFFIVSIVLYFLSERQKREDMRKFTNFYMVATVVKMVVYLSIIFIYVMNFREDGKKFAITFLAYYLVFSIFETFKLSRRDDNASDGKQK
ncbi:MAG: hypothetical protein ACI358_02365 [Candidatus Limimorpha sp.]